MPDLKGPLEGPLEKDLAPTPPSVGFDGVASNGVLRLVAAMAVVVQRQLLSRCNGPVATLQLLIVYVCVCVSAKRRNLLAYRVRPSVWVAPHTHTKVR